MAVARWCWWASRLTSCASSTASCPHCRAGWRAWTLRHESIASGRFGSHGVSVMHGDLVLPIKGSSTPVDIVPRKVAFDWSKTPLHWLKGDAFSSHVLNVLHIALPAGEFWFCRVYSKAMPLITDDRLRADIQAFLRQES